MAHSNKHIHRRHRLTGPLLAGTLVLALAACSGGDGPAQGGADGETITLTLSRPGDSKTVQEVYTPIIEAFEAAHPNIKVETIEMGFDESFKRFPLMAATGTLPDISIPSNLLMYQLAEGGALMPIEDRIGADIREDVPENLWASATFDGEIVGIPGDAGSIVLWYNADVFTAAGLDPEKPPTTWDEMREYAQIIEEKTDADGIGLNGFARNDIVDVFSAFTAGASSRGTWFWDESTQQVRVEDSDPADALDFLASLVSDGLTQPSVETYNRADARPLLRDGKVGMIFDGPWPIGSLKATSDPTQPGSPYRTALLPGKTGTGRTTTSANSWVLSATTEHPDEAMELMRYLVTGDAAIAQAFGYGGLPTLSSLMESDKFQGGVWTALIESLSLGVPAKPVQPDLTLVNSSIPEMVQRVLLGQQSGKQSLRQLADSQGWD